MAVSACVYAESGVYMSSMNGNLHYNEQVYINDHSPATCPSYTFEFQFLYMVRDMISNRYYANLSGLMETLACDLAKLPAPTSSATEAINAPTAQY